MNSENEEVLDPGEIKEIPAQPLENNKLKRKRKKKKDVREVIKIMPSKNRALIKEGDLEEKVHYIRKNNSDIWKIAKPGFKPISIDDWINHKADLLSKV